MPQSIGRIYRITGAEDVNATNMVKGGRYNWCGQPDRMIYLGKNWSGNGYWHQFKKIGDPREVWCEVLDGDLQMIEETQSEAAPSAATDSHQS